MEKTDITAKDLVSAIKARGHFAPEDADFFGLAWLFPWPDETGAVTYPTLIVERSRISKPFLLEFLAQGFLVDERLTHGWVHVRFMGDE